VLALLAPGAPDNSVAVLVHHYGPVVNGRIMAHAPGLALLLEAGGGSAPALSTAAAAAWRGSAATQYLPSPGAWSSIPDAIDARALAALGGDWTARNYSAAAWEAAAAADGGAWGALAPRAIPLLREAPLPLPPTVLPSGAPLALPLTLAVGQSVTLNLTQMAMVYSAVSLRAVAGSVLHIEFALRFKGGAPAETYGVGTTYTAADGLQSFTGGDTWCAHYVTLTCAAGAPINLTAVAFVQRAYPFTRSGSFGASDALLTEVWRRAVNTLQAVSDDAYGSDARERNEWLQDPAQPNFITTRVALVGPPPPGSSRPAYSDARLLRNLLRHATLSQLPDGRILSTFPTDRGPEDCHYAIEDYALQYMEELRMYYNSTGDLDFVRECYPAVKAQMAYFAQRVQPSGLLLAREYTSFDDPLAYVTVQGGALNAFYAQGLRDAAALAALAGDAPQAAAFAASAAAVTAAMEGLWNASAQTYSAGVLPGGRVLLPSVHSALLALERGVVPPARAPSVYAFFRANYKNAGSTHCCTNADTQAMLEARSGVDFPVVYYWVFRVLYAQDSSEADLEALAEIRRRWGAMVAQSPDIDTLWESFQDSESAHNYGAVPAYFLSTYVLGVHSLAGGSGALAIEPRLADLTSAQGTVVTEVGLVTVSWQLAAGALHFALDIPAEATGVQLRLIGVPGSLVVNGSAVASVACGRYQCASLGAGPAALTGSIQQQQQGGA
jgi:hypothetical protein